MKRFSFTITMLAAFMLATFTTLQAQENSDQNQIIVIQKATNEDGNVTIKKKRFDRGESPEKYIEELKLEEGDSKKIELTVVTDGSDGEEAETVLFIRSGNGEEEVIIKSSGDFEDDDFDFNFDFDFDFDEDQSYHHDNHRIKQNKALIGIYPESVEEGVLVTSLVYGGGARKAGIEAGDVITSIDGKELSSNSTLRQVMADYQPGDVISVNFIRGGQSLTTDVTLTERGKTSNRNPCKVFIGVSLGSSYGEGIRISGTIDGWPAGEMALEPGDRILAMDGVRVEDFDELLVERNKHQAGEAFTLTILRDGATFDVDGQFKECPKEEQLEPVPQSEVVPEETPSIEITDNLQLDVEVFNAYPNPTAGMLNIRFQGEAAPTVVTVTDINGQQVYREKLDDFNGYYAREVDLSKGTPGTMSVTVRQGDKVASKPVILLNRA